MWICEACGARNPSTSNSCDRCRASKIKPGRLRKKEFLEPPLPVDPKIEQVKRSRRRRAILAVVSVAVVAATALAVWWVVVRDNEPAIESSGIVVLESHARRI